MMTEKAAARWQQDPFKVGVLGLALMLAGYFLMRWVPAEAAKDEATRARLRAAGRKLASSDDPEQRRDGEVLRDDEKTRPVSPPYELPGRLTFYLGLAVIGGACLLWYTQAQTEGPPREPEETAESEPEA
jgi:hypothetical protein